RWNCEPIPQSKERNWKPSTYSRRACPRPYLNGGVVKTDRTLTEPRHDPTQREMPSGSASLPRFDPRRRPWHTSSGVDRHGHDRSTPCIDAPISRQTLSHATKKSDAPHRWSSSGASVVLRLPAGASSTPKPHVAPLQADA